MRYIEHKCIECGSRWPGYHYVHCIAVTKRKPMSSGDWLGVALIVVFFLIILQHI